MKKVSLETWIQLIGMLSVLGGLIFLAIEVNHSSRLAEVTAYQSRMEEIQAVRREIALSPDLAALYEKFHSQGVSSLSPVEYRRLRSWQSAIQRGMQSQYFQYQQGFLDRQTIDQTLEDLANGVYVQWVALDLINEIQPQEWKSEIDNRLNEERSSR
jgi:hypothetical protein